MKMKRLKKFVSLLTAVALCALLPSANAMTASADTPVTYYFKYVNDTDGWKFQTGGWSDTEYNRDPYYMHEEIKDGDIVVIDSNGTGETLNLTVSKRLSNLTVVRDTSAVVAAPSIDEFFALAGSASSITGDIGTAYAYDDARVTFLSNVGTLNIIDTRAQLTGSINVVGTAGHVTCKTESGYVYFEVFNVAANKLVIDYGSLKTDAAYYSTTPDAAQTTTTSTPAATATTTTPAQTSSASSEYDDVPKTGESNTILWLLGIAALCLTGRRALKKI